jgi:hypothetical protein
MYTLKDGSVTKDKRLDRIVHYDERSKNYPIRELVADKKPRSYTWRLNTRLDQGSDGACVGFSWSHEMAARPVEIQGVTNTTALNTYYQAQQLDDWPGGAYPNASPFYEGTSVLAGAKAVQAQNHMKEYRWAFNVDDIILAVGHHGPGVMGLNWTEDMFTPDANGFVKPTGAVAGGHAILIRAVNVKKQYVTLANSWGTDWGKGGDCYLTFDDLATVLKNDGEFCIPVGRKK